MLEGASSTVSIAELQKKALEKRSSFTLPPDRNGHWEVDGGNLVLKEDEASAQQYALKRDFMMSLRSADVKKVPVDDVARMKRICSKVPPCHRSGRMARS